jgi:drug/metabolite transporter (DMT)-like permease
MSAHFASPRARSVGLLLLLITSVGWGLNWPVIKVVLREWPPLFARGTAGLAGALALASIALTRGERLAVPESAILRLITAAALNVFAWMGFSTIAMKWLTVSEAALLVYTMPIWVMLLAWPIIGTRPTFRGIMGLALGTAGLCVLFGGQGLAFGAEQALGAGLALGAALLFALGTVTMRTPLPLAPISIAAWQVGIGCLPMVLLGLAFEPLDLAALTAPGWAAMAYMALVPMGLCYLTWFAALRRLPPATASLGTLLTPVVGIVVAGVALGEPLGAAQLLAMGLTLSGVAVAIQTPSRQ